jgi:hypothetical protein
VRLKVEVPEAGIEAIVSLHNQFAPTVCSAVFESIAVPLETPAIHACFGGHQVHCFLPGFSEAPPVENSTLRPVPGDVMFFYAARNAYAWMHEERPLLGPGSPGAAVCQLAFVYGTVDLQHAAVDGWYGSLVGHVTIGLEDFADVCARTLNYGSTPLRLSQVAG